MQINTKFGLGKEVLVAGCVRGVGTIISLHCYSTGLFFDVVFKTDTLYNLKESQLSIPPVPKKPPRVNVDLRNLDFVALCKQGLTYAAIGRMYGLTGSRVSTCLRKYERQQQYKKDLK